MDDDQWLPVYESYFDFTRSSGEAPVKCVLHDDSHASATLNLDKGLWRCHVCQKGGDIYTLLMEAEGLNFVDAVKRAETITSDSGGEVRSRTTFERYGYGLPQRKGNKRRGRKYVPSWRRG